MAAKVHPCRYLPTAAALAVLSLVPEPAQAAPPQVADAPDWAFGEPAGEVVLAAASLSSLALLALPKVETGWGPSWERPQDDGYGTASDFTGSFVGTTWQLVGGWALEGGYYQARGIADPHGRALRTTLIDGEAVLLATGISGALKRLTGRCRPRAWHDEQCDADGQDGFPSGHVTPLAALAGTRFVLAAQSDGEAVRRQLAFGFAEGATLATGVLRILAGAHSWEDVVAAWAIGHATGALTALAHPVEPLPAEPPGTATGAGAQGGGWDVGLRWSGAF
ncbi:MAG: phosphatase PAP2 family protein [Deltaproteobacteria bacterium]|nr:phosphatase PAP2 family protein [Deltaproteobacteria bacterium]